MTSARPPAKTTMRNWRPYSELERPTWRYATGGGVGYRSQHHGTRRHSVREPQIDLNRDRDSHSGHAGQSGCAFGDGERERFGHSYILRRGAISKAVSVQVKGWDSSHDGLSAHADHPNANAVERCLAVRSGRR